jgi:clan AA aspartic protease
MGAVHQTISIAPLGGGEPVSLEALVDSGATYTWVPKDVLARIGIQPEERRTFVLADGREAEYDVAWVRVAINGRTQPSLCIFGEPGTEPLLGVFTLEAFGLGIDPVNRDLVPVKGRLARTRPLDGC